MRRGAKFILAVAILVPACATRAQVTSSDVTSYRAAATNAAYIRLLAAENGPGAVLTFDTATLQGARGSLCWSTAFGGFCADVDPHVMVPSSYLDVPRGTILRIQGDARTVSGSLARVTRRGSVPELVVLQRLQFAGGTEVISLQPGRYTLELIGSWPQGEAPFYFGLSVRP